MRKKWIYLNTGLILISLIAIWCMMRTVTDAGITGISNITELQSVSSDANVISLSNTKNDILENKEDYLKNISKGGKYVHHNLEIFIVKPDGDFEMLDTMYRQNCTVEKVIQGENITGEKISIYTQGGLAVKNSQINFVGNFGKNIMIPENRYLVFVEKVENDNLIEQIDCKYKYRTIYALFNVLNISSDYSYVPDNDEKLIYKNYLKSEFFVQNQETLDALLSIKQEIIDTYLK